MALLHSVGSPGVMRLTQFKVGACTDMEIAFLPSRSPLKATLLGYCEIADPPRVQGTSIGAAVAGFGQALGKNPWLRHYPVLLNDVFVSRFDRHWIVRHPDGTFLPIAHDFEHKWIMHALGGGQPLQVAAVWDGRFLFPLSVFSQAGAVDLNAALPYMKG